MNEFLRRSVPPRWPRPLVRTGLSLEDILCCRCRPPNISDAGASWMFVDKKVACLITALFPRSEWGCAQKRCDVRLLGVCAADVEIHPRKRCQQEETNQRNPEVINERICETRLPSENAVRNLVGAVPLWCASRSGDTRTCTSAMLIRIETLRSGY